MSSSFEREVGDRNAIHIGSDRKGAILLQLRRGDRCFGEHCRGHQSGAPPLAAGAKIICECFGVTDKEIERAIRENNLSTVEDVTNYTKAGGGCGECRSEINALLIDIWSVKKPSKPVAPKKLTNLQKIALIQEIIEAEIRPGLQADNGDLEVIDIEGNKVIVELRGMCTGCLMSDVTIGRIQEKLRELVSGEIVVETQR